MSEELKPCPFCSGKASIRLFYGVRYGVFCDCCDARVGGLYIEKADAIAAWNRRTLGLGTCEMEYVSDFMSWHCKACDQLDMAPRNPKPRYCKWCGRKVVEE